MATVVGVWVLGKPLVAVAIYHTGILFVLLNRSVSLKSLLTGFDGKTLLWLSILCLSVWPLLLYMWPILSLPDMNLSYQLQEWGFTGHWVIVFILYSISIHPILEETFWRELMPDHFISDILFAGFHVLVMVLFLKPVWVLVGFFTLVIASTLWRSCKTRLEGILVPVLSHAVADLAIVIAVVMLVAE